MAKFKTGDQIIVDIPAKSISSDGRSGQNFFGLSREEFNGKRGFILGIVKRTRGINEYACYEVKIPESTNYYCDMAWAFHGKDLKLAKGRSYSIF